MNNRILLLVGLLAALIAGIVVGRTRSSSTPPPDTRLREQGEYPAAVSKHVPQRAPSDEKRANVSRANVERYNELRERLALARQTRLSRQSGAALDSEPDEESARALPTLPHLPIPGSLDKDYIREQMGEIVPLVRECYDAALVEDPELGGRITVEIKLIGEEDIGGLIESSAVVPDQSDVTSPGFLECVSETMYAIELKAPESGGTVVIRYPLQFSPANPLDDDEP